MFAAEFRTAESPEPLASSASALRVSWKQLIKPVESFLDEVAQCLQAQVHAFEPEIVSFARYALSNQGKQLRPALVALSGGCGGPVGLDHVKVGVIIEMVHLATLVHDDIMDEADMRRNRPTVASNWGNEVSVLLGDCLFAQALKLAAEFPTTEVCHEVSQTTRVVCSGEIYQTLHRGDFELASEQYFKVLGMKTGALFAAACHLGGAQSHAGATTKSCLREFGHNFGIAYQIFDDCLDVFSTEEAAGKSLGTDFNTGKLTLPLLVARERADQKDRGRLHGLFVQYNRRNFGDIVRLMRKYEAPAEALVVIRRYLAAASNALHDLPQSENRDSLIGMAHYLAARSDQLLGS